MPKRPVKRITFSIEQFAFGFRIRAALYDRDTLVAMTTRTVTMRAERGETADAAELVHLVDELTDGVTAYVRTDTLPFP
jgi:hypothetical protein